MVKVVRAFDFTDTIKERRRWKSKRDAEFDRLSIAIVEDEFMAMGKRRGPEQEGFFVTHAELPRSSGHPFYRALERELRREKFDKYVEELCSGYYHESLGRPGLVPGVYFRCLLIGYFEGIDSERGIAWRVEDSLSLREFLGLGLGQEPPDHSTISRTRRLIDLEAHKAVFQWVLKVLARKGILKGKTLGIDSTTIEANAALRSIVRRDTGQTYEEYLTDLAKKTGIKTPTREDLARIDKKRPKKGSNEDWVHPQDPDAQITKMKDGGTHLAHKQEHAVDLETGAIVAATVQGAVDGDCSSIEETLGQTLENLHEVRKDEQSAKMVSARVEEAVADKGYHSDNTLMTLEAEGVRSYVSEPERGRRRWKEKQAAKRAVYRNRRRKSGARGQRLRKRRGEVLERTFAHTLETGGMRRVHLRTRENILKRVLIHVAAFDLGLLMRKLIGVGTPRGLQEKREAFEDALAASLAAFMMLLGLLKIPPARPLLANASLSTKCIPDRPRARIRGFTTGC